MQVEVTVQNYYQAQACLPGGQSFPALTPDVASAQWEHRFLLWLNILQPQISATQAYELSLRLTDDSEIQALNAQYRLQNRPTDVLAFAALEVEVPQFEVTDSATYLGDIVISVETAARQAEANQHSLEKELVWLAAHGLLHLLGWDHPDENSLKEMLLQQQVLLAELNLEPVAETVFVKPESELYCGS